MASPFMNMPADLGAALSCDSFPPSLHLATNIMLQPERTAHIWPAFGDLRAAAYATRTARLRLVTSALLAEARIVFGACYLLTRAPAQPLSAAQNHSGQALHNWIQALLEHGSTLLPQLWHWTPTQSQFLYTQLAQLVAPVPWSTSTVHILPFHLDQFRWEAQPRPFPAGMCAFLHALRVGAPWSCALQDIGGLADGFLSLDGHLFATSAVKTRSGMPDRCAVLSYPNESDALMLYFAPDGLVAVASTHSLLPRAQPTPTTDLVISARRPPFATSFLPSYIKLKKKPTRDVMSVFRAASAWHRRLGPLDATAATIIGGQLHMPKPRFTFRPSIRPNHASWERNEAANSPSAPNLPPGPGRAS